MAKTKKEKISEKASLRHAVLKQMLTLSTSAFGLVAALAWNEAIKEALATYIKPYTAKASGLISLLIYAVVVTLLAVLITYSLTKIIKED
jgi:uncharacterized membrane protein (DUF106 family)